MENGTDDKGPRNLIEKSGLSIRKLSQLADLDNKTVWKAKRDNKWPAQERTRTALKKALGIDEEAA